MAKWFFAALVFTLLLSFPVFAEIVCTNRSGACLPGEGAAFKLSATANAHAELANQSNYDNYICCYDTDGVLNKNDFTCDPTTKSGHFISLSSATNAHAQFPESGHPINYPLDLCFKTNFGGAYNCAYYDFQQTEGSCIYSLSGPTNAHVSTCGEGEVFGNYLYCFTCSDSSDVLKVNVFTRNNGELTGVFNPGDTVEIVFEIRNFSCSSVTPSSTSLIITKEGKTPWASVNYALDSPAQIDAGLVGVQRKFVPVASLNGFGPYKASVSASKSGEALVGNNSADVFFTVVTPDKATFNIPETNPLMVPLIVLVVLSVIFFSARRHRKRTSK